MTTDDIGDRGQALFYLLMADRYERDEPLFRPRFLGDKFPTIDYFVELVDRPEYFFFVQVKATTQGYTEHSPYRLKVQVSQVDIDRMVACPVPTYVVGMDITEAGYGFILSVNEPRGRVASLTTAHRINGIVLEQLRDEVVEFWTCRDMTLRGSRFVE